MFYYVYDIFYSIWNFRGFSGVSPRSCCLTIFMGYCTSIIVGILVWFWLFPIFYEWFKKLYFSLDLLLHLFYYPCNCCWMKLFCYYYVIIYEMALFCSIMLGYCKSNANCYWFVICCGGGATINGLIVGSYLNGYCCAGFDSF